MVEKSPRPDPSTRNLRAQYVDVETGNACAHTWVRNWNTWSVLKKDLSCARSSPTWQHETIRNCQCISSSSWGRRSFKESSLLKWNLYLTWEWNKQVWEKSAVPNQTSFPETKFHSFLYWISVHFLPKEGSIIIFNINIIINRHGFLWSKLQQWPPNRQWYDFQRIRKLFLQVGWRFMLVRNSNDAVSLIFFKGSND